MTAPAPGAGEAAAAPDVPPATVRERLRPLVRAFVFALVGGLVAWSCPRWPEPLRPACALLAEIADVLRSAP